MKDQISGIEKEKLLFEKVLIKIKSYTTLVKKKNMLTKDKIISGLQKLPDNVTIDEVLDHIVFLEKIENGLDQAEKGQVLTEEEMDEKIKKWFE